MLFDQYAANFNSFGICYYTTDTAQVVITHLPLILTKVEDDAEFLKDSLLQHCYDLHDRQADQPTLTTGSKHRTTCPES